MTKSSVRRRPGRLGRLVLVLGVAVALVMTAGVASAQESIGEPGRASGQANPLKNVYFGEQHMHTENSFDAFTIGSGTWEDAYRYAVGEVIKHPTTGADIKRVTPYDFVAITDHAEYYGVLKKLVDPNDALSKSDFAKGFALGMKDPASGGKYITQLISTLLTNQPMEDYITPELLAGNWADFVAVADRFNKPGEFTTLYGFEWTSIPNGQNMHRNVFFREKAPPVPYSAFDSQFPADLWTYLETMRNAGIDNFAIPHNGNVSDGWMFSPNMPTEVDADGFRGVPMNARYAERQQRNEPLFEIGQIKGSSDTHPWLSPNDEFANFEIFDGMVNIPLRSQIKNGFYRQALGDGFRLEKELGTNPFKMGLVGGADFHTGYQGNEEFNYQGGHSILDDTPKKRLNPNVTTSGVKGPITSSAYTTAVWAEENTRAGIFDAMKSKETYGTSGTLIRLRFFGGWAYPDDLTSDPDFVQKAYDGGVPMGGDLPEKPAASKAPTFAVWALKDPESGNLDRIQIIKVYLDPRLGRSVEKIYNVALADGREVDKDGNVPPVGNTVDLKTAKYTNDIGDSQLAAVWTDPDFDPAGHVAYYVRALEIPTPRWSTYDSVRNNLPITDVVPPTIQERAWSSPIWYTPGK